MATIIEATANISINIQDTFSELIKLTLRKTIKPTLNPYGRNSITLYNAYTGRYERGFIGNDPSDSVSKYTYAMVTDTLGWTSNNIVTFKITPKGTPPPSVNSVNLIGRGLVSQPTSSRAPVSPIPLSFSTRMNPLIGGPGRSMSSFMGFSGLSQQLSTQSTQSTKSVANAIINQKNGFAHICSMSYTDSYSQLGDIGIDIVNQTDSLIAPQDSARMTTAQLRIAIFNLERSFEQFFSLYPDLYDEMFDMIRLINSENTANTPTIISLIGTLSVIDWNLLSDSQQEGYINKLGQNFITDFNSNEMIAILLKSPTPELILTISFYYSLQKMMYIVFGYNKLIPNLFSPIDPLVNPTDITINNNIQRCCFKNMGAYITRVTPTNPSISPLDTINPIINNTYIPDCMPPPQSDYDFIKIFIELYPAIAQTMGGASFPEPCQGLFCSDIPDNYDGIFTLNDYLTRFNEFSYCSYLLYIDTKLLSNSVGVQIDNRIRYLKTF